MKLKGISMTQKMGPSAIVCIKHICCKRRFSINTAPVCAMVQMSATSPQSTPAPHSWTVASPISSANMNPHLSNQLTLWRRSSFEATSSSASQKNPHIFETQMFIVMLTTACHISPVQTLPFYCFNIHFNTKLSSIPISSKRSLSIRFSNQIPG